MSAGSGGGRGVGGLIGDERWMLLRTTHWSAGVQSMWSAQKNPRFQAETAEASPRMSRVCVGTPKWSSVTAMASFITTPTSRGERPQPSRRVSQRKTCRGSCEVDKAEPGCVVDASEVVEILEVDMVGVRAWECSHQPGRTGG